MSYNPWLVKNFRDYWYLNCPECTFKTKEVYNFKVHAVKSHPLSCVVFRSFIASDSKTNPVSVTVIEETVKVKEETNEDQITDPLATLPKNEKIHEESYEQNGINENQIAVVKNENYSVVVSMPFNPKRKAAENPVIIPNKKPKLEFDIGKPNLSPFQLITEALEKSPVLGDGNKSPLTLSDILKAISLSKDY